MTAIETHYLGPTNYRGSRYVASTSDGHRIVLSCDYRLTEGRNHAKAASALRAKLDWGHCGPMLGGWTKKGMAWVFTKGSENI